MISICIPIYNCNLYNLTVSLVEQCTALQIGFEILLIDDASGPDYLKTNSLLEDISNVRYIRLEMNIGRSAIRNLFVNFARFDYLLFMDCDSHLADNKFIFRYIKEIEKGSQVVCGGRIYADKPEKKKYLLRWKYGISRECTPSAVRAQKPYHSFLSNNFLIRKEIFERIKFDERIRNYGHEDTLFGYRLKQDQVLITHINNPLVHEYNEDIQEFIIKTRAGIENLYFIHSHLKPGPDFSEIVKLLRVFRFLEKTHMRRPFACAFSVFHLMIGRFFQYTGLTWLWLFDFYKLGYFCVLSLKR